MFVSGCFIHRSFSEGVLSPHTPHRIQHTAYSIHLQCNSLKRFDFSGDFLLVNRFLKDVPHIAL